MLQNWAEAVLTVCRTLPDADLTRDAEQQASNAARPLFRQSVEAYQQVLLLIHTAVVFEVFLVVLTSLTCIDTPKMHLQTTQLPENCVHFGVLQ